MTSKQNTTPAKPTTRKATRKAPASKPTAKQAKPAAKSAKSAKSAPSNCGCGCGRPAITTKAVFLPGHDARLAGVLGRAIGSGTATAEQTKQAASLSDRLRSKIDGIAKTERERLARKTAREAAAQAAKDAFAKSMAS